MLRRFAEVVTSQELERIKKHAPSMAEALEQLTRSAELGDVKKALLAFDEVSLDQVSALAKGLSEQTREALAAFMASV